MSGLVCLVAWGPLPPPPPNIRRFPHVLTGLMLGGGGLRIAKTHPRTKVKEQVSAGERIWKSLQSSPNTAWNAVHRMLSCSPELLSMAPARSTQRSGAWRAPERSDATRAVRLDSIGTAAATLVPAESTAAAPPCRSCNLLLHCCCMQLQRALLHADRRSVRRPTRRARRSGGEQQL